MEVTSAPVMSLKSFETLTIGTEVTSAPVMSLKSFEILIIGTEVTSAPEDLYYPQDKKTYKLSALTDAKVTSATEKQPYY